MIWILAPEPASWIQTAIADLSANSAQELHVWAPWALPATLGRYFPKKYRAAWARRSAPQNCQIHALPGFSLLEAGMHVWAKSNPKRSTAARFVIREAMDRAMALLLKKNVTQVVAPSCAALYTFAAARKQGIATTLVQDVPLLRQLHTDLDQAAAVHPECIFLRNYRAQPRWLIRQEQEHCLADALYVRGLFAKDLLQRRGIDETKIKILQASYKKFSVSKKRKAKNLQVLLAGPAAARYGTMEALHAVQYFPNMTLWVRPSQGLEPSNLLQHPQVKTIKKNAEDMMPYLDCVIAPTWCEADLPEVWQAAAMGIPVLASNRVAHVHEHNIHLMQPGDTAALMRFLRYVLEE